MVLLNGSIQEPIDDHSRKLVQEMNNLRVEYAALDVTAKPDYLKSFKEGQQVPYVFLNGVPACDQDGLDALAIQPEFKAQTT